MINTFPEIELWQNAVRSLQQKTIIWHWNKPNNLNPGGSGILETDFSLTVSMDWATMSGTETFRQRNYCTVAHEQQKLKEFCCISLHLVQYNEIIFAITAVQLEIGYWICTDWKSAEIKGIENAVKLSNSTYIWVTELWMCMANDFSR